MKWLLVSSRHDPSHGGIGTYVHQMADAATRAGWSFNVMTRTGARIPGARTIEVAMSDECPAFQERVPALRAIERIRPYRYGLWALGVAERLLDLDFQPDVIEFTDCMAEGVVALTSRIVRDRFRGVPMIVHVHGTMAAAEALTGEDVTRFGRSIYHGWEREAINAADAVIGPSLVALNAACARVGQILAPPMAMTDFAPRVERAPGPPRILLVGSLQPLKGVDIWIESLKTVLSRSDAEAMMVGPDTPTGPQGAGMAAHLWNVLPPEIRGRVAWRPTVPRSELLWMIEQASVVVVPSLMETFSYVAAEALAAGTPVIVSDRTGIREHAPGIEVVPVGDVDALAAAQLQLLHPAERFQKRWQAARTALQSACDPLRVISEREALTDRLHRSESEQARDAGDSIARMKAFLKRVEEAERAASAREAA